MQLEGLKGYGLGRYVESGGIHHIIPTPPTSAP